MAIVEIPVRADIPSYQFRLELETVVYTLRFRWNTRMASWIMDIADEQDNDVLVGIRICTNTDLVQRFCVEGMPPGLFLCYDETGKAREPDRETFGNEIKLFYQESV